MQYNKQHIFDFQKLTEDEINALQISTGNLKAFLSEARKKYVHSVHSSIKAHTEEIQADANALPDVCSVTMIEDFCYKLKVGVSVFKSDWREIYEIAQSDISVAICKSTVE